MARVGAVVVVVRCRLFQEGAAGQPASFACCLSVGFRVTCLRR
jgi:hypothetical protein